MKVNIGTTEQIEKMACYFETLEECKKVRRRIENKKVADLVAQGIEKSIARDMVKFGLA